MKEILIVIGILLVVVVGVILLAFGGQSLDVWWQGHFQPKYEQVRVNTFETSKAYNQGEIQNLQQAEIEYMQATPVQRKGLASIMLHRMADYDENRLPPDLLDFKHQLQRDLYQQ